jgi:hypothetical protein
MPDTVSDLAGRLAEHAEAVCRHYLSHGHRAGRYWIVGDVHNTPGRSLYVRLQGPPIGRGAAGRWVDAATNEHGDLLDLIVANRGFDGVGQALDEARRFLGLAPVRPEPRARGPMRLLPLAPFARTVQRLASPASWPALATNPCRPLPGRDRWRPPGDCSRCPSHSPAPSPAPTCGRAGLPCHVASPRFASIRAVGIGPGRTILSPGVQPGRRWSRR